MDLLQVETLLSFEYVLTIILNNVWTCMAILTAGAISLIWTTSRYSSPSPSPYPSPRFEQDVSPSASPCQESNVVHSCSVQSSEPVSKNVDSTPVLDCTEGVIKGGKFAVYYCDDEVREEDFYRGNLVCAETEYENVTDGVKFYYRELNLGWYRCLDLTVFSGNVVKLWD